MTQTKKPPCCKTAQAFAVGAKERVKAVAHVRSEFLPAQASSTAAKSRTFSQSVAQSVCKKVISKQAPKKFATTLPAAVKLSLSQSGIRGQPQSPPPPPPPPPPPQPQPQPTAAVVMCPRDYFASLEAASSVATRATPFQVCKVDRTRRSWLHERYDVLRTDGVKLEVTPSMMALFYDLTVQEATQVLRIPQRTMRRLRNWCGLTRWPRNTLIEGKHAILTLSAVREERLRVMQWAWESGQFFLYGLVYEAHSTAGCPVRGLPTLSSAERAKFAQQQHSQPPPPPQQQHSPPPPPQQSPPPQTPTCASEDDIDWGALLGDGSFLACEEAESLDLQALINDD